MVPSILGLLIGGSKFGSLPVHGVLSLINLTVYSGRVSSVARGKWILVSQT